REEQTAKVVALAARQAAGVEQAYVAEVAAAKSANDALLETTKGGFKALVAANDDYLGQIRQRVDKEKRLRESVLERQSEEHREREHDRFEAGLQGKSDKDRAFL